MLKEASLKVTVAKLPGHCRLFLGPSSGILEATSVYLKILFFLCLPCHVILKGWAVEKKNCCLGCPKESSQLVEGWKDSARRVVVV